MRMLAIGKAFPGVAAALVDLGPLLHCSVCVAELATGVANAGSARPGWKAIRDHFHHVA